MAKLALLSISTAFRHRKVQKDCQNRKREIGKMPLDNCPFLKTGDFQSLFSMWLRFYPNEEGRKGGERKLIYARHVFVGFVEGKNLESGIRNSEYRIRNPFPFVISRKSFGIRNIFISFSFVLIIEY